MKRGEFEFRQIVTAVIVLIVLILILIFLTNINKLRDILLNLTNVG